MEEGTRYAWCWVLAYFCTNFGLTLHNKWVLDALHWSRPWTLTAIHIGVTGIGAKFALMLGNKESNKQALDWKKHMVLVAFSILHTLNIAVSNISMLWVSLAFHQVTRSGTPVATVLIQWVISGETCSWQTFAACIMTVIGVCLSTVHEVSGLQGASIIGVSLATFGVFLAATKGVATNRMLVGSLQLSTLQVLAMMTIPCVLQCLLFALLSGELEVSKLRDVSAIAALHLLTNGLFAFAFNYVSFSSNAVLGPLTLSIISHIKQVGTVVLAMILFDRQRNSMGVVQLSGVVMTLVGGAWYSSTISKKRSIPLMQESTSGSSEVITLKV